MLRQGYRIKGTPGGFALAMRVAIDRRVRAAMADEATSVAIAFAEHFGERGLVVNYTIPLVHFTAGFEPTAAEARRLLGGRHAR